MDGEGEGAGGGGEGWCEAKDSQQELKGSNRSVFVEEVSRSTYQNKLLSVFAFLFLKPFHKCSIIQHKL